MTAALMCPTCKGTGDGKKDPIEGTLPCEACFGAKVLTLSEIAELTITEVVEAGERVAIAYRAELDIDDERPLVKADAVRRIMTRDNIAATPAEKIVETDAEYMGLRNRQKQAVVEKIRAEAALASAKLRARLCVGLAVGVDA